MTHICFSYLDLPTDEHISAMISQTQQTNLSFCAFKFQKNAFSMKSHFCTYSTFEVDECTESTFFSHSIDSNSRATFLQSPYPEHFPEWILANIKNFNIAYAGYGIPMSNYYDGHFRTPIIQNAKYLLASSKYELDGYLKNTSKKTQIILTGNPLLYEIRRVNENLSGLNVSNPVVLWAPHWSTEWLGGAKGFSRWNETFDVVYEFAKSNPDIRVVFRPHPILREAIWSGSRYTRSTSNREALKTRKSIFGRSINQNLRRFLELENVEFSTSNMADDVTRSSHLITEGVSIIAYWAATGKPILVLRGLDSPKFNYEGEKLISHMQISESSSETSIWLLKNVLMKTSEINMNLKTVSEEIHPTFNQSPISIFQENII